MTNSSNADDRDCLSDLLLEFSRCCEDPAERATFLATLVANPDSQTLIFRGIQEQLDLLDQKVEADKQSLMTGILRLLLEWSRAKEEESAKPWLVLQYVPNLLEYSFALSSGDIKRGYSRQQQAALLKQKRLALDAFLLALYSRQATSSEASQFFTVQGLTQSSIYHDGSRMDATGIDCFDKEVLRVPLGKTGGRDPLTQQRLGTQGRMRVAEVLYRSYNETLGDLSRASLQQFVRTTQHLLQRGGGRGGLTPINAKKHHQQRHQQQRKPHHHQRVYLSAGVLLELLQGAYFCIYNGFQPGGSQILELIRLRGSALGDSSVLSVVNAVRTLVLTAGPSQLPSSDSATGTGMTTPSQIAKNLITNASFRTKKMGDDIPKVEKAGTASDNDNIANNLKVLANMTSISEEAVEEALAHTSATTPTKARESTAKTPKDKLRAKLPNLQVSGFKKRLGSESSTSDHQEKSNLKASEKSAKADKQRKEEMELKPLKTCSPGNEIAPSSKKREKTSKIVNSNQSNGVQQMLQQLSQTPTEIDSIEQVEALIQMKKLPAETVAIHSPESGTTIF